MFLSSFSQIVKKRGIFYTNFKHSDGNFVTFLCQFFEKLVKNCPKNVKLKKKNLE